MKIKLLFFSSASISIPLLKALIENDQFEVMGVFCQPDKAKGRKQILTAPEPKVLAEKHGIPVYQPQSLKKEKELLERLKSNAPDFLVTFAYGQILSEDWLELAKLEPINVHASLLPKYRGASPLQAALLNGDGETGFSTMRMVKKMDYGAVAFQHKIPLSKHMSISILHDEVAALAAQKLPEDLVKIFNEGSHFFKEQNHLEASYCSKITREDGYIDFKEPALTILRKFHAYNPWPGLWTQYNGKRLKLIDLELSDHTLAPGELKYLKPELHVGSFDGSLHLKQIQIEGKGVTHCSAFIAGNPEFLTSTLPS